MGQWGGAQDLVVHLLWDAKRIADLLTWKQDAKKFSNRDLREMKRLADELESYMPDLAQDIRNRVIELWDGKALTKTEIMGQGVQRLVAILMICNVSQPYYWAAVLLKTVGAPEDFGLEQGEGEPPTREFKDLPTGSPATAKINERLEKRVRRFEHGYPAKLRKEYPELQEQADQIATAVEKPLGQRIDKRMERDKRQ